MTNERQKHHTQVSHNFILRNCNNGFMCIECKNYVRPHPHSARNHCPYCLTSLHVDDAVPGDRDNKCGGVMQSIRLERHPKSSYRLIFRCTRCGQEKSNQAAPDDNFENLLAIAARQD